MNAPEHDQTEENAPELKGSALPAKMWRDDVDPVAQVAKRYEIALREQREEHQPIPLVKQGFGYLLGGLIGIAPGALFYHFGPSHTKPNTQILAHTAMTFGTIMGIEMAREVMHSMHDNKEKGEAGSALAEARQQARASYAQSVAREREERETAGPVKS